MNITKRKQVKEVLNASEEKYRTVVQNANEGITVTQDGIIKFVNPKMTKITGYSQEELLSRPITEFLHPDDRQTMVEDYGRITKGDDSHAVRLCTCVHRDGSTRWAQTSIVPIRWEGGYAVLTLITDITKQKQAEEKLRAYSRDLRSVSSQLELAEEQERRSIAMRLHDEIGTRLALCKIKLGMLQDTISSDGLAEPLTDIRQLLEVIIKHTRSLSTLLSPPALYEFGLDAALDWLVNECYEKYGIPCQFQGEKDLNKLDENTSVILFRAVRELLFNVIKHSKARHATVCSQGDNRQIQITVRDDGVGFDTSVLASYPPRSEGYGLFSISERLKHLKGSMEVESEPGKGTTVTLLMPFRCQKKTAMVK